MTRTGQRAVMLVPPGTVDQLRGASRLAVEATRAVADLVQAMQHEIGGGPRVLGRPLLGATRLVSAPVYAGVRTVARLVGAGAELTLAAAALLGGARSTIEADTALAVLNGVAGDYLAKTQNPLAIEMALRHQGERVVLEPGALRSRFHGAPRKLLVFSDLAKYPSVWTRFGRSQPVRHKNEGGGGEAGTGTATPPAARPRPG